MKAPEETAEAANTRSDPYNGGSWDWYTTDNERPAQEEIAGYSHSDPQNNGSWDWRAAEHEHPAQQDTAEVVNTYSGPQNGVAENEGPQEDTAVAEAVNAHSDPQNGVAENEGREEDTAVAEAVNAHSDPENGVVDNEGSAQAEAANPHSDPQNGEPCDSHIAAQENHSRVSEIAFWFAKRRMLVARWKWKSAWWPYW